MVPLIGWSLLQTVLGWASPTSRPASKGLLLCRTALAAAAVVGFRETLEWFASGLAVVHAGTNLMAFYPLIPRPGIFVRAAAAEWTVTIACLGVLATVATELAVLPAKPIPSDASEALSPGVTIARYPPASVTSAGIRP